MNIKQQFEVLEKLVDVFQEFDGKPLKNVRSKLFDKIKSCESGEFGWRFFRLDDKITKRVKLWAYENYMEHNMHPDFEIGIDEDGIIWVQNDILWKTLTGLNERIQEERQYEYKYGRA